MLFPSSRSVSRTRTLAAVFSGRLRRSRSPLVGLVAGVVTTTALSTVVHAQTLTAANRGWYNGFGSYSTTSNYLAGQKGGVEYRDFQVYNIPTLTGGLTYTSATLQFQLTATGSTTFSLAGNFTSFDTAETFDIRDATTSATSLTAGTGGTAAFADLGTGVSYGTRSFSNSDNATTVSLTLNAAGLAAINAAQGGQFVFGGFVSTLAGQAGDQLLFSYSDTATTAGTSLVLTSAASTPEPCSAMALLAGVMPWAAFITRRRYCQKA